MIPDPEPLLNPKLPQNQAEELLSWLGPFRAEYPDAYFILTSGSSSTGSLSQKWIIHSRTNFEHAAEASNEFLECRPRDRWYLALPTFHVGGLSILFRAHLTDSAVVRSELESWEPESAREEMIAGKVTLASFVPTQLFDFVTLNLAPPPSLRAILIGGGALSRDLYIQARALGWPILPTYGLTETCSQVATAPLSSLGGNETQDFPFQVLPHLRVRTNPEGRIQVSGSSVSQGQISLNPKHVPSYTDLRDSDGWLTTEDIGAVQGNALKVIGRANERLKVNGELVYLQPLRDRLTQISQSFGISANAVCLIACPHPRAESEIVLVTEAAVQPLATPQLVQAFNESVAPFERISRTVILDHIPRTELGKIKFAELVVVASKS